MAASVSSGKRLSRIGVSVLIRDEDNGETEGEMQELKKRLIKIRMEIFITSTGVVWDNDETEKK